MEFQEVPKEIPGPVIKSYERKEKTNKQQQQQQQQQE